MTNHREQFIDAIANAATIARDEDFGGESATLYLSLEEEFSILLDDDEQPSLAFLSFVPVGARNRMAITALLEDRLIVGWTSGLFRKRFESLVVPYSTIRRVTALAVSDDPSLGGNPAVMIEADKPVVIAVPPKGSPLAGTVRDAIADSVSSQQH